MPAHAAALSRTPAVGYRPHRAEAIAECRNASECHLVTGEELSYSSALRAYLGSTFCLHPPGDTPMRRGLVDSIVCGCIPVVRRLDSAAYAAFLHPSEDGAPIQEYSERHMVNMGGGGANESAARLEGAGVLLVAGGTVPQILRAVRGITSAERAALQRTLVNQTLPRVVYSRGQRADRPRDALDVLWSSALRLQ